MNSSTSSSDDNSCGESKYPTISLQPQGSTKRSCEKRSDKKSRKEAKNQKLAGENSSEELPEDIKIYKPEECMKYMNLEIHQTLLEKTCMFDLARELGKAGARLLTTSEDVDPATVYWCRIVSKTLITDEDEMKLIPVKQRCDVALYVCSAQDIAQYVNAQMLTEFINNKSRQQHMPFSLVVYGLGDYFKSSDRRTKKLMTESDLEMAIADVLVNTNSDVIKVNDTDELTMLLLRYTKAIAETPYKNAKRTIDDQAAFYMRGDNKNCIAVHKDGTGLSRLWQQMLAVLPSSSLEIARTLIDKYKSPREFYKAVSKPDGVKELANVGVSRTGVPGAKSRRIGPEFARKMTLFFTSQDGDMLIE